MILKVTQHSDTILVSPSDTILVSHSDTILVSHSDTVLVSHSDTILVSHLNTFMYFRELFFFILENCEMQFLLLIKILKLL